MKRTYSDTIPITVEKDGDGSYLYRWDVREVVFAFQTKG